MGDKSSTQRLLLLLVFMLVGVTSLKKRFNFYDKHLKELNDKPDETNSPVLAIFCIS